MALLNVPASYPVQMWTVVRYLSTQRFPSSRGEAKAALSPSGLFGGAEDSEQTFDNAIRTLADLRLVTIEDDRIALSESLRRVDFDGFGDALRSAVLDLDRADGIEAGSDQTGAKDLIRALVWFLTLDPLDKGIDYDEAVKIQDGVLPARVGQLFSNSVRWGYFYRWAPALGLADRPLFGEGRGTGERATGRERQRLVPDCTQAVRRVIQGRWSKGERVNAVDLVDALLVELPVLPGGRFSQLLEFPVTPGIASMALSFAFLRGHDEGWIELTQRADSPTDLVLYDPAFASQQRRVTHVTVQEATLA